MRSSCASMCESYLSDTRERDCKLIQVLEILKLKMSKTLKIYVNDELWELNVSDAEFQAAITGNDEVIKLLVAQESERRTIAMINNELQVDEPEESADISTANEAKKESFVWPDQAVLLFLETYRNKEPDFASGLKRHNKIWMEIANEMCKAKYNVTAAQCQNKMSGLKRTYKNIRDSNNKSGNYSSSWAFYSVMESIFGEKAWLAPVSIASSDGPLSPGSSSSISSENLADDIKPKKRRVESILESFITEIREDKLKEKEDREQRRAEKRIEKEERQKQIRQEQREMHKDKMQFQQSLIEILAKIVERK